MRLTKSRLKRIIREEKRKLIREAAGQPMEPVYFEQDVYQEPSATELGFLSIDDGMEEARLTIPHDRADDPDVREDIARSLTELGLSPRDPSLQFSYMGDAPISFDEFAKKIQSLFGQSYQDFSW